MARPDPVATIGRRRRHVHPWPHRPIFPPGAGRHPGGGGQGSQQGLARTAAGEAALPPAPGEREGFWRDGLAVVRQPDRAPTVGPPGRLLRRAQFAQAWVAGQCWLPKFMPALEPCFQAAPHRPRLVHPARSGDPGPAPRHDRSCPWEAVRRDDAGDHHRGAGGALIAAVADLPLARRRHVTRVTSVRV
jgi:hypothetical protein